MHCRKCHQSVSSRDKLCPGCGYPLGVGQLSAASADEMAKSARGDLERAKSDAMLAQQDAAAELTRDLELAASAPLSPAEIDGALDKLDGQQIPSMDQLEQFLSAGEGTELTLEGVRLSDLLEEGVDAREILRKGMIFLRNRRYGESVQWWSLQRERLDRPDGRTALLLLIMEMLTHVLAGDLDQAARLRGQVRSHPSFSRLGRAGS